MSMIAKLSARWQAHRRHRAEMAEMSDEDLTGLGMTRGEFTRVATMSADRQARMRAMAGLFGLPEAEALRPATALGCTECTALGACRKALAEEDVNAAKGICPNAPSFERAGSD